MLPRDLERIAAAAAEYAAPEEELSAVLATESTPGRRIYLCAFGRDDARSWVALDDDGRPVEDRADVRDAVSIAVLCEVAAETAGGGDLEQLRAELAALRLREAPPGIEEAEDAALALERAVGVTPRLATPAYLDEVGAATLRLERVLGDDASPFAEAMKGAIAVVETLAAEVERTYKRPLVSH